MPTSLQGGVYPSSYLLPGLPNGSGRKSLAALIQLRKTSRALATEEKQVPLNDHIGFYFWVASFSSPWSPKLPSYPCLALVLASSSPHLASILEPNGGSTLENTEIIQRRIILFSVVYFQYFRALWLQNGRHMGRRGGQDKGKTRVRRQLGRPGTRKRGDPEIKATVSFSAPCFSSVARALLVFRSWIKAINDLRPDPSGSPGRR